MDALWDLHAEQQARDRQQTEDPLPVWGQPGAGAPELPANADGW